MVGATGFEPVTPCAQDIGILAIEQPTSHWIINHLVPVRRYMRIAHVVAIVAVHFNRVPQTDRATGSRAVIPWAVNRGSNSCWGARHSGSESLSGDYGRIFRMPEQAVRQRELRDG